ncbi:MAG TPA: ATP-binding protein [Kofleriaceae bacterium]
MTTIASAFDEALRHPVPGYALGKRLGELFPDRSLLELETSLFNTWAFKQGGHCTIDVLADVHAQYTTSWYADGTTWSAPRCEASRVTWRDTAFDVFYMTWSAGEFRGEKTRAFVLGPTRTHVIAFVDSVCRWNHEVRGEILVYNGGCFSKDSKLFAAVQAASFDDLVLDGTLKQQIRDDFAQFLGARETYEAHGVPWKRGALLLGPPGNGKTLCVKALVHELGVPCIYVQSFQKQHGTVQSCIEQVFERARATAPCVIVLEDIDALLVPGSHSFFLNELDGFASNAGVITLATTNHAERLDPSIVDRPSRFDRKYHFELPTAHARHDYIVKWNARLEAALRMSGDDVDALATATAAFSFAYIQEVFVSAMMRWMVARDPSGIAAVAHEQVALLREQMTAPRIA